MPWFLRPYRRPRHPRVHTGAPMCGGRPFRHHPTYCQRRGFGYPPGIPQLCKRFVCPVCGSEHFQAS